MGRKKVVKAAGKFGARYGKKQRAKFSEVEELEKQDHMCPRCKMRYVRRVSSGIWQCGKCGYKFAGLAYLPSMQTVRE